MRYGCSSCPLKAKCTTGNAKRLKRWEKEAILDQAEAELRKHPHAMRQRKEIAEHPYSTIKHWMGSTHFLTRRLPSVKAEMSLHVLAYNMRRAINLLGTRNIVAGIQA
jgi:prophage antirepressor-like protein